MGWPQRSRGCCHPCSPPPAGCCVRTCRQEDDPLLSLPLVSVSLSQPQAGPAHAFPSIARASCCATPHSARCAPAACGVRGCKHAFSWREPCLFDARSGRPQGHVEARGAHTAEWTAGQGDEERKRERASLRVTACEAAEACVRTARFRARPRSWFNHFESHCKDGAGEVGSQTTPLLSLRGRWIAQKRPNKRTRRSYPKSDQRTRAPSSCRTAPPRLRTAAAAAASRVPAWAACASAAARSARSLNLPH